MRSTNHVLLLSLVLIGCTEYKFHDAEAPALPGEDSAAPDTSAHDASRAEPPKKAPALRQHQRTPAAANPPVARKR